MTNETEQLQALIATLHEALEKCRTFYASQGYIETADIDAVLSNTAEAARLHDLAVTRKALEDAALIADKHWPESGHVPDEGAVSCAMSISVEIRRLKQEERV